MQHNHHLLDKIDREKRGRSYFYPLLSVALILGCFWILIGWLMPMVPLKSAALIALLGGLVGFLGFRLTLRVTKRTLREAAKEIDQSLASKNQLEMMVEWRNHEHPLRAPHEKNCEKQLSGYSPKAWGLGLVILGIILGIEVGGVVVHIPLHYSLADVSEEMAALEENLKEPNEPPVKENEFAELHLIRPESEIRAKPMDEIAWDGAGNSSNGFADYFLSIYLNGEWVINQPVESSPVQQTGEVELSGAFFLDDLSAQPFDVISYHLTAHSDVNDELGKEIISVPQFIAVRPFEEGAFLPPAAGADENVDESKVDRDQDLLNMLRKLLRFQLVLNKAAYAARASGLSSDSPVFLEQVELLTQEQLQLKAILEEFLRETDPENLTPHMLTSLRSAEDFMAEACVCLNRLGPAEEKEIQ